MMLLDKFKEISIRGRVAFAIYCLENFIIANGEKLSGKWLVVLNKLWVITSLEFVDEWLYQVSSYMPSSILEDDFDDLEEISKTDYLTLKSLYEGTDKSILEIIEKIFILGTIDLYGEIIDNSSNTLRELRDIISICEINNIKLPSHTHFNNLSIKVSNGWGKTFKREDVIE